MDYKPFFQFHIEKNADATICFTKAKTKTTRFGYGIINRNGQVSEYSEKPDIPLSDWVSMTVYLFKKDFLIAILNENAGEQSHEFGRDIILRYISTNRVFGFKFNDYWAYARTVDSYYKTNMDLLKGKINLLEWQIRTNLLERCIKSDRLPAYIDGDVSNSIISEGCVIKGKVKNSLLSPGVTVAAKAKVIDSIIFHDTKIEHGATLKKVICDKDSHIGEAAIIGGRGEDIPSKEFGDLLSSGITILGRNTTIPPKTVIRANTAIYSSETMDNVQNRSGNIVQ
jgi:glucose-1-phosphate adenylyltransferase